VRRRELDVLTFHGSPLRQSNCVTRRKQADVYKLGRRDARAKGLYGFAHCCLELRRHLSTKTHFPARAQRSSSDCFCDLNFIALGFFMDIASVLRERFAPDGADMSQTNDFERLDEALRLAPAVSPNLFDQVLEHCARLSLRQAGRTTEIDGMIEAAA
jgi:hypothetical protein